MQNKEQLIQTYGIKTSTLYTYKNKNYVVLDLAYNKGVRTRLWYPVVIYQGDTGLVFTREINDFKDKFEKVI